MKTYDHIWRAVRSAVWMIQPEKLEAMVTFLALKLEGKSADEQAIADIRAANEVRAARAQTVSASSSGSVAVLPLYGVITHRSNLMGDFSGPQGTSVDRFTQQLRQAVNDPSVKSIVIDVDSPGGSTDGVDELATEIYQARKQKKIVAISNSLCASAAYYLASQASEMVVSPSSITGSIGVYCLHEDCSEYMEKLGVKNTFITYGENKAEGNDLQPLTDSAREHMQELVDNFGMAFEKAVGRGRGVKASVVHEKFGQGRVFTAQQAVKIGMADRIGTLDDELERFGVSRSGQPNAAISEPRIQASAPRAGDSGDPENVNDDDDNEMCMCACSACKGGDCSACACDSCACDGCTCDSATETRKKAHAAMRRRLQLASL